MIQSLWKSVGVLAVLGGVFAPSNGIAVEGVTREESEGKIWFIQGAPNLKKIRERLRDWDQAVLGFRKEHNFVLLVGPTRGRWKFKRWNNQINKTHEDAGVVAKASYSYHEQIFKGFGYFLGTSGGYWEGTEAVDGMGIQSAAMIPGVQAGLVLNLSPGFRLISGIEYYLERWNALAENDKEGVDGSIHITARTFDILMGGDIFFDLKWAVRFEAHRRWAKYDRPRSPEGRDLDARIEREDEWLTFGLLHHIM